MESGAGCMLNDGMSGAVKLLYVVSSVHAMHLTAVDHVVRSKDYT